MAREGYLVLARKYRPRIFAEVIGQPHVVQTLTNALAQGRVHHAYLFTGSRGLGKTSTARILAAALNCESADDPVPEPCGECDACKEIRAGVGATRHILNEIDGASNRSVEDARELRRTIGQKTAGRYHVIVIDEVHMLTTEAFNTLLKTLEEPPRNVKFVFATTEVQKLPETIISRCVQLDFRRLPVRQIVTHLQWVCEQEDLEAEAEALELIARVAEGGVRDALSMLDQASSFCAGVVTARSVEQIFGILTRANLLTLADALARADYPAALGVAERVYAEGLDLSQVLRDLLDVFRDLAVVKTSPKQVGTLLDESLPEDRKAMKEIAPRFTTRQLLEGIDILLLGLERVRTTGFGRLVFEAALLKVGLLKDSSS